MSSESQDYRLIECSRCGRTYRWEQRLAGKVVVCRCGEKIRAPGQRSAPVAPRVEEPTASSGEIAPSVATPAAPASPGDDYELNEPAAPHGHALSAQGGALKFDPTRGGIVPSNLPPLSNNTPTPPPMTEQSRPVIGAASTEEESDSDSDEESHVIEQAIRPWQDIRIPIALAALGVLLTVGTWHLHFRDSWAKTLTAAGILIALQALIFLPISLWSAVQGSRWMGIAFGPVIPLLLKLAAMTLGTGAIADALLFGLLSQVEFDWTHILVGFLFYMVFVGAPLWLWYRTDLEETALIIALQAFPRVAIVLLTAVLAPDMFAVQHEIR